MIAAIATLRVQPEHDAQFRKTILGFIAEVRLKEADTLTYQLTASRTEPNVYKMLEIYRSETWQRQHMETPYFLALGATLGPTLAAAPEIEFLDAIEP
jgi:quinol monooxygenase YgiN